MTPPELTRDTPVLHVLHPSDPVVGRDTRLDFELACLGTLLVSWFGAVTRITIIKRRTLRASSAIGLQLTHH